MGHLNPDEFYKCFQSPENWTISMCLKTGSKCFRLDRKHLLWKYVLFTLGLIFWFFCLQGVPARSWLHSIFHILNLSANWQKLSRTVRKKKYYLLVHLDKVKNEKQELITRPWILQTVVKEIPLQMQYLIESYRKKNVAESIPCFYSQGENHYNDFSG